MERKTLIVTMSVDDFANLIRSEVSAVINEYQQPKKEKDSILKPDEACRQLRISRATLWRWQKNGYLLPIEIGGSIRYRQSDIDKLLGGK